MSQAKPHHTVFWIDGEREPQCAPDPRYPKGIDLDIGNGAIQACKVELPYPAKRIGRYFVNCNKCNRTVMVTTAGRPDDPKSVTISCKKTPTTQ